MFACFFVIQAIECLLVCARCKLMLAGGLELDGIKVVSNSNHSMVLFGTLRCC